MNSLAKLFDQAGGRCMYCQCETYVACTLPRDELLRRFGLTGGEAGVKKALRRRRATREHLVRVADGGGGNVRNLGLACFFCNITRGEATPAQHAAAIAKLVEAGGHPNHRAQGVFSQNAEWKARRAAGLWTHSEQEARS